MVDLVVLLKVALEFTEYLLPYPWGVPDHYAESAVLKDDRELFFPVEGVDPINHFLCQIRIIFQDVPPNQGVAALDVVAQVG